MQQTRFRHAHANKDFDCYDCRKLVAQSTQFVWDNLRNIRICPSCHDKLVEMVGSSSSSDKISWTPESGLKPWQMGDYDINSWSEDLQLEYRDLERKRTEAMYSSGFNLAFVEGIA